MLLNILRVIQKGHRLPRMTDPIQVLDIQVASQLGRRLILFGAWSTTLAPAMMSDMGQGLLIGTPKYPCPSPAGLDVG